MDNILGDPGAVSRVDKMFVVKVYCKIETSPWALTLTEPVPEAFELPASDWPEKIFSGQSAKRSCRVTLVFSYTNDNFLAVLPAQTNLDKLSVLENFVSPSIFRHIEECTDYGAGVWILQALFVKPRNEIFARHILATRCQQPQESKRWMKSFKLWKHLARTATSKVSPLLNIYPEESIRDAFITGLRSPSMAPEVIGE